MSIDDYLKNEDSVERPPQIRRGRIPSFAIYEVSEDELQKLQDGFAIGLELNFSLMLLSSALSFFIALITTQMSQTKSTTITIITAVFAIIGIYLFFSWFRSRPDIQNLVSSIKSRMPANETDPEKEQSS